MMSGKKIAFWGSIASIVGLALAYISITTLNTGNSTKGDESPIVKDARDVEIHYGKSKNDIAEIRTVLGMVVQQECSRISKEIEPIFDTGWVRCDVHIAKLPRIGLSVEDLMTISQKEGISNFEDVAMTIAARAEAKAELDQIKDYLAPINKARAKGVRSIY